MPSSYYGSLYPNQSVSVKLSFAHPQSSDHGEWGSAIVLRNRRCQTNLGESIKLLELSRIQRLKQQGIDRLDLP